jgi:DNA-binding NtrC family response regulator
MRRVQILIVDDEPDIVDIEREILEDQSYAVSSATSVAQARKLLSERFFDLLVLDEQISSSKGTELLVESRSRYPGIGAIFVTGYADLDCAVRALRAGALDLLQKPVGRDTLLAAVKRALDESQISRESRLRWYDAREKTVFHELLGESVALRTAQSVLKQVIPTAVPLLIEGESGTGKELAARAVHFQGPRKHRSFVPFNTANIPSSLMESILFGYRKGAFTDAREDRPGLFEIANGGTVFLDEVGDMTPEVQVRLLRVLQEKTVTRVGDHAEIPVDARVVAATNRSLKAEVERGRFRSDLYFRLAVVTVTMPPLRARAEDLKILALHLIEKAQRELKKQVRGITPDALAKLGSYGWPGNVRELDNVIQRSIILTTSEWITPDTILLEGPIRDQGDLVLSESPFSEAQIQFERTYFTNLLAHTAGNITRAARIAKIDRTVLYAHLRKIGLDHKRE